MQQRKDKTMADAQEQIKETVTSNDVVLFMKGTSTMPQCGFSSRVAGVLNYMGVAFKDVNVLEDEGIRQGIKDYSDWPTIPQASRPEASRSQPPPLMAPRQSLKTVRSCTPTTAAFPHRTVLPTPPPIPLGQRHRWP